MSAGLLAAVVHRDRATGLADSGAEVREEDKAVEWIRIDRPVGRIQLVERMFALYNVRFWSILDNENRRKCDCTPTRWQAV